MGTSNGRTTLRPHLLSLRELYGLYRPGTLTLMLVATSAYASMSEEFLRLPGLECDEKLVRFSRDPNVNTLINLERMPETVEM